MKAIALTQYLPIEDPNSLFDAEVDKPVATGKDILVNIKAIAVNPVDTKVRRSKDITAVSYTHLTLPTICSV